MAVDARFEENLIESFMKSGLYEAEFEDWQKYYSNGYYCARKLMMKRAVKMGLNKPGGYSFRAYYDHGKVIMQNLLRMQEELQRRDAEKAKERFISEMDYLMQQYFVRGCNKGFLTKDDVLKIVEESLKKVGA